ncbi:MAG: hypothetical protein ABIH46_07755 [Chloroflexota bacterium]
MTEMTQVEREAEAQRILQGALERRPFLFVQEAAKITALSAGVDPQRAEQAVRKACQEERGLIDSRQPEFTENVRLLEIDSFMAWLHEYRPRETA